MSKASKYAEAKASISSPTHFSKNPLHQTANVTDEGSLYLSSGVITPQEALRLRDWLTETFEDEQLNSKPEKAPTSPPLPHKPKFWRKLLPRDFTT